MSDYKYSIKNNRLKNAYLINATVGPKDEILTAQGGDACIFLMPIDGGIDDSLWGRLSYNVAKEGEVVLNTYVGSSRRLLKPAEQDKREYMKLLDSMGAGKWIDRDDILLYDLEGRYLYIAFVALGNGKIRISDIMLDRIGDNFQQTFPEIYQERGGFFHRYISIFSSIYDDVEYEIDNLPKLLDLDICDARLLPIYASWFGLDVGDGLMNEDIMRPLVKEAYQLGRMKGTRWCLERITEIILGNKGIVVERNNAADNLSGRALEEFNRLYGDSVYDITVLTDVPITENRRKCLNHVLMQYLPVRSSLNIVCLNKDGVLDSHSYMDVNARVYRPHSGNLDEYNGLDANITLS